MVNCTKFKKLVNIIDDQSNNIINNRPDNTIDDCPDDIINNQISNIHDIIEPVETSNKQNRKEYHKIYAAKNKEKIQKEIICDQCGIKYSQNNVIHHKNTKKHNYLIMCNTINVNINLINKSLEIIAKNIDLFKEMS